MLRRALLSSALLICGAFGFAEAAKADTIQVPFSATVDGVCELANVTAGTLEINAAKDKLETDTPGSVDYRCISTTGRIYAFTPVQTSGPSDLSANREVRVSIPGASFGRVHTTASNSSTTTSAAAVADDEEFSTAKITMSSLRLNGRTFQAGTYSYSVAVTVTPN